MKTAQTEAYLSGGICGPIWWPIGELCGRTLKVNLHGIFNRFSDPAQFSDALESILMAEGGDFQSARFTADTEIVFIRKTGIEPYKYQTRVKIWELGQRPEFSDYVNQDAFTGDFMGE